MGIMNALKVEAANTNLVQTENGALGFEQHQSNIVDFFYKISTMRQMDPADKRAMFLKALAEDKELAYRMLFFSRDIRGGLGERKLFRDIYSNLDKSVIDATFKFIPEFGRWDDLIDLLLCKNIDGDTQKKILKYLWDTLQNDLDCMGDGKPCSLLAKWMPSIRKVSHDKMKLAKMICWRWGWPEKMYRQTLSKLRGYIRVVEKDMTAGRWGEINFEAVPSKAAKNYRKAFARHDTTRYNEYLGKLQTGEAKVNAGAMYPYEIVSAYRSGGNYSRSFKEFDQLLESQWKALPLPKNGILGNAIVVRDGSGSMTTPVSGNSTALDVATALSVLMSENLKGEFKDKFITFSSKPRFVDLSGCNSLRDKLSLAFREAECSNTDIEKTMDLILRVVVKNKIPQSEIPAVVIVSDMEFDEARNDVGYFYGNVRKSQTSDDVLFATISRKWEDAGYELPKMVFWNVDSRTAAVPMQENKNGLLLVSGFSQNILDMLSNGGTMLDAIREKLMDKRYDCIAQAISSLG